MVPGQNEDYEPISNCSPDERSAEETGKEDGLRDTGHVGLSTHQIKLLDRINN